MTMSKCCACRNPFTWTETMKNIWTLKRKILCPVYGTAQFVNAKSRQKAEMLLFIPLFLLQFILRLMGVPLMPGLIILLLFFSVESVFLPFVYEYSKQKEPLW